MFIAGSDIRPTGIAPEMLQPILSTSVQQGTNLEGKKMDFVKPAKTNNLFMTDILPVQSRTVYKWTTEREHTGETPEMKRKREERNEKRRLKYANRSEAEKEADKKKRQD